MANSNKIVFSEKDLDRIILETYVTEAEKIAERNKGLGDFYYGVSNVYEKLANGYRDAYGLLNQDGS